MIFEGIDIENIGVYDGKNSISLLTKGSKNIVLIGGENGAGKTTIIDAIKLCLYGNNFIGYTKTRYEKFISDFIRFKKNKASISIKINNNGDRYTIVREWSLDEKLKENLTIFKNSEILSDLDQSQWQDFIIKMIPLKLINFFLFDGEKIEKMVNDFEETEFAKDIKQILGINVLEDLDKYLSILHKKYLRSINSDLNLESIEEIAKLYEQKDELRKKIEEKLDQKNKLKNELSDLDNLIKTKRKEYFGKLETNIKSIDEIEKNRFLINEEIKRLEQALKELISKDAPYILALDIFSDLVSQLKLENLIKESINHNNILKNKFNQLIEIFAKYNLALKDDILDEIKSIFSYKIQEGTLIHNIPDNWYNLIHEVYTNLNSVKNELLQTYRNLLEKEEQFNKLEKFLEDINSADFLSDYIEEILNLEKKKEETFYKIRLIDEEIKDIERDLQKINKQINELEDKNKQLKKVNRVFGLISDLIPLIVDIKNNILINKVDYLKKEILYGIKMLFRKENFIKDLDIDISDFRIKVYSYDGRELEFSRLSAGERQMFAVAFLWGLMRASGKKLPVVIDTPLGRLDYSHRVNIVRNFFPYVSHQVVILSTNTEIDYKLLKEMDKFISKSYTLEYKPEYLKTVIKEGYFSEHKLRR